MATIDADIREIRQTVYGRDMREPIADALEHIRKTAIPEVSSHGGYWDARTAEVEQMSRHQLIRTELSPMETWYTYDYTDIEMRDTEQKNDKTAEVISDGITVTADSEGNYIAIDAIGRDSVSLISEEDYMWNIPNPVKETHVHHGEDWMLVLTRREE